jgi:hypothetical protein
VVYAESTEHTLSHPPMTRPSPTGAGAAFLGAVHADMPATVRMTTWGLHAQLQSCGWCHLVLPAAMAGGASNGIMGYDEEEGDEGVTHV